MPAIQQVMLAEAAATGGRNTSSLSQISGIQALFDLDATLSASYSGSGQTWANLIASPDDGLGQTAYDFTLGATSSGSTDDPTFNGSANDAAAYFSLDGGDFFQISGGNTTKLKNIHKTTGGTPITAILAMRANSATATESLMGTQAGTNSGWSMRKLTSNLRSTQMHAGSGSNTNFTQTWVAGTDYLMAVAVDHVAASIKFAVNARTFTAGALSKAANTTDPTNTFQIGAVETLSNVVSGTRIYGAYLFDKLLSDADLSSVVDVLNSRHNRTYA